MTTADGIRRESLEYWGKFNEMKNENKFYSAGVKPLEDEELFCSWYKKMPAGRREKIDNVKPPASKRLSLGAGIVFCRGLLDLGIDPDDAAISFNDSGKPYIDGKESIFFNLSHSGEYAVGVFSDREVGADVEKLRKFKKSLIEYVFDESEIDYISNMPLDMRDSLYTRLWTMKESFMKFTGMGISMSPKKIVFGLSDNGFDGAKVLYEGTVCENLYFSHHEITDYHITVCSEYEEWNEVDLLSLYI